MKIRFGIATIAAVSSTVLTFGNTAHAAGPNFLGYPPSINTKNSMPIVAPAPVTSNELAPSTVPKLPVKMPSTKFAKMEVKKLQEQPAAIATETTASFVTARTVSDSRNTYVWGQCTWHVKNKRPDLPNGLGNGGQWVGNAAARGFATGSTPRAGAVGEQVGHVVYVESVNSNGTVNISEMNYNGGVGVVHTRTVSASTFTYIY